MARLNKSRHQLAKESPVRHDFSCAFCKGTGRHHAVNSKETIDCRTCEGTGRVQTPVPVIRTYQHGDGSWMERCEAHAPKEEGWQALSPRHGWCVVCATTEHVPDWPLPPLLLDLEEQRVARDWILEHQPPIVITAAMRVREEIPVTGARCLRNIAARAMVPPLVALAELLRLERAGRTWNYATAKGLLWGRA